MKTKKQHVFPRWDENIYNVYQIKDLIQKTLESLKFDVKVKIPSPKDDNFLWVGKVKTYVDTPEMFNKSYGGPFFSIRGFARHGKTPEAHNLEDYLWKVMSVVGHELGHAFTTRKKDPIIEEVKAYAFQQMWSDAIKRYNIAGLRNNLENMPTSDEGSWLFHNDALEIMYREFGKGISPRELYDKVVSGRLEGLTILPKNTSRHFQID